MPGKGEIKKLARELAKKLVIPNIWAEVRKALLQIPRGKVTSYKAIALALGDERAARAIARLLPKNPELDKVPCYKVVHSDGRIGGYVLGIEEKIRRLRAEGIGVKNGKAENFENLLFADFKLRPILRELQAEQIKIARKVELRPLSLDEIELVAGVDIAYLSEKAIAAAVVLDKQKNLVEKKVAISRVSFPYIPTYLAYRELKPMLSVIAELESKVDLIFVDGNGLLHPRFCGIATHLGVLLRVPTIGVAKKLLLGERKNDCIYVKGRKVAKVLKLDKKELFVSPGNLIDLESATRLTKSFVENRAVLPVKLAHKFANEAKMALKEGEKN